VTVSFLLFLRGLVGVLVAFAIVTFLVTHSLWTTLIQTAICGILIQIGYFAVVLFLVWRSEPKEGATVDRGEDRAASKAPLAPEKMPVARRTGVPEVPRSGHS
jgi:exopolysaccharide production repressor protein